MPLAILRRVGEAFLSALGGGIIVFALLVATPGDPAARILNARGDHEPLPEEIVAVRQQLGLDEPLPVRFVSWLGGLLHGDFGLSWRSGTPVAEEFATRLPATGILTVTALGMAVLLSIALGVTAGWRPGAWTDHVARILSATALALPVYLIGVLLLDLIAVRLGWGLVLSDGSWATVFWPALTLALPSAAVWSRVLRSSLLDLSGAGFLRVAAARGSSELRNLFVHRLPNALPPFLTVVGLGAATLLGGAPIAETVFSWPGVGRYTVEAIQVRDMPVVTAFTMIAVLIYVVASLLVDLLVILIDPRQRATSKGKARS